MRRAAAAGTAVLATAGGVWWAASASTTAPVVASRIPVVITASSIDVGRLVYRDTVEVQTAAGSVPALELGLDDATFHGLDLQLPCVPTAVGGLTGRTAGSGASGADLTVYATDLVATIDGTRVRLSSADPAFPPPAAGTVLVSDGTLHDPTLVSALLTTPSLRTTDTRTTATFCTPHGRPTVHGGVPLDATPSVEPTAEPSGGPNEPGPTEPTTSPTAPTEPTTPTTSPSGTTDPSGGASTAPVSPY
ncbi:MAG TPA: hypothetical protein VNS55_13665 [Nocardioides sp.]|nr:hypothetical protein [Nocardioides sp.]